MGIFDRVRGTLSAAGNRAAQLLPGQGDDERGGHSVQEQERAGATPFLHDDGGPGAGTSDPHASQGRSADAPARPRTHTLQPGETLDHVAERYDVPLADIVELNGIEDPALVFAGQVFKVPGRS